MKILTDKQINKIWDKLEKEDPYQHIDRLKASLRKQVSQDRRECRAQVSRMKINCDAKIKEIFAEIELASVKGDFEGGDKVRWWKCSESEWQIFKAKYIKGESNECKSIVTKSV